MSHLFNHETNKMLFFQESLKPIKRHAKFTRNQNISFKYRLFTSNKNQHALMLFNGNRFRLC